MVPEHGDAPRSRDYKALALLLSYTGKWSLRIDLHNRHRRFQHRALLSELQREIELETVVRFALTIGGLQPRPLTTWVHCHLIKKHQEKQT